MESKCICNLYVEWILWTCRKACGNAIYVHKTSIPFMFGKNFLFVFVTNRLITSDVRYVSIYRNIEIFIQYRDTISAFGCIDTLVWAV